ncbi:hypothetical protein Droror1_Dr00016288 [Drosera rotundifolia]
MNEGMTSAIDEDDERIGDKDYQSHEFVGGDIQNDQQSCQGEQETSSGRPFVGMMFETMDEARQHYVDYVTPFMWLSEANCVARTSTTPDPTDLNTVISFSSTLPFFSPSISSTNVPTLSLPTTPHRVRVLKRDWERRQEKETEGKRELGDEGGGSGYGGLVGGTEEARRGEGEEA